MYWIVSIVKAELLRHHSILSVTYVQTMNFSYTRNVLVYAGTLAEKVAQSKQTASGGVI